MSIVGVMLGVCVLIIVQSVMNGFGEAIRSRLVDTQGEIRIISNEIIYDWEEQVEKLQAQESVLAVAPFAEGVVMLQSNRTPQFPVIRGVDPIAESQVIRLEKFISLGDIDDFDDDGVFLGEGLAYALRAGPGSTVEVFTPLMLERLKQEEVLLPREFNVIGTFRTGSPQVDANMMISTLRVMQELYGLEDGVHGMSVKLRPGVEAWGYSQELEAGVVRPGLDAVSWLESNSDYLFALENEKRMISFIIIFIILVSSFSITIALMMAVMRKTREIGLIVAMGGRPVEVAFSFCIQGMVIGIFGTAFGFAMGVVCLHYRGPILSAYSWVTNSEAEMLGIYNVYEIPVHYLASDFIGVASFALIMSTLAGLIPALRAARLKPADALRSE